MTHTAGRTPPARLRGRWAASTSFASHRARPAGRRHPLVAVAMVLPLAVILAIVFGTLETVTAQASSVAGMLGH